MALTRATQVCAVEEGTGRLEKATVSGGGAQRPVLCDWESGEGALEQKIEYFGARRKAQSPEVRSPLPPRAVGSSVGSARQGDSGCGLAGAPWAPASYPTAPQAHVQSPASSPRALPPRGPGLSACGANGWTGAPSDSAFLQREDREGNGRRPAGSAAPSAVDGLRGSRAGAGRGETSLSWGCGSAGFPRGRVARQLPSSGGAHDGPAFHGVGWYSGAARQSAAAQARSLLAVIRLPCPRDRRRSRGRAPGLGSCPRAPVGLLRGGPASWAIAGAWPPQGSAPVGVTASAPPPFHTQAGPSGALA